MTETAPTVTQQWNRALMGASRDVSRGAVPTRRYAILSVPRSGSTLLARGLEATGELGVPLEYLNQNAIDAWMHLGSRRTFELDEYLADMESRRTSASGWFGLKTHYRHFEHHFGDRALEHAREFLLRQDRLVLITRSDQVAAAVSYHRARTTGMWSSEHAAYFADAAPHAAFDADALTECLREVDRGERMWRQALSETGARALEMVYEELVADYRGEMARVLEFLDCPDVRVPDPQLSPTPRSQDDLVVRFREFLANSGGT